MKNEPVDKVPCSPRVGQAMRILSDDQNTPDLDLVLYGSDPGQYGFDPCFTVSSGVPNILMRSDDDPAAGR